MSGRLIAIAILLGFPSYGHSAPAKSDVIRITGSINRCYGPEPRYVFLEAAAPKTGPKTPIIRVGKDRHFVISVPSSRFTPGDYYLNFNASSDRSGFGALRIKLAGSSLDIGLVGDCDV